MVITWFNCFVTVHVGVYFWEGGVCICYKEISIVCWFHLNYTCKHCWQCMVLSACTSCILSKVSLPLFCMLVDLCVCVCGLRAYCKLVLLLVRVDVVQYFGKEFMGDVM